ncbi:hypothetical protein Tco_1548742 [Tanacetum coccineum]
MKSFEVLVGKEFLSKLRAEIEYSKKVIQISLQNGETLVVQGGRPGKELKICIGYEDEQDTIILSTVVDARTVGTTTKNLQRRIDLTKFIALSSTSSLCQGEGQIDVNNAQSNALKEEKNLEAHKLYGANKKLSFGLMEHLDMSTTYHPQTDGQSERTTQTFEELPSRRKLACTLGRDLDR